MKSELEMVYKTVEFFKSQGLQVTTEVPFLHRSIDLVYKDEDKLISIEFKISNWRKALEQARSHLFGSQEVYICLPRPKKGLSKRLEDEISLTSIGLLFFDEESELLLETVIKAEKSPKIWSVGEIWLNEAFNNRLEVC